MQKYLLAENYGEHKHAGSKAMRDVFEILTQNGYTPLVPKSPLKSNTEYTLQEQAKRNAAPSIIKKLRAIRRASLSYFALNSALKKIERESIVFIQYPFVQFFVGRHFQTVFFRKIAQKQKIKFHVIIHDLNSLRDKSPVVKINDIEFCSLADLLICHTPAMKNYLVQNGIDKSKIRILNLFDYLTTFAVPKRSKNEGVVFAGNLEKSVFLHELSKLEKNIQFNLYGAENKNLPLSENIFYKGSFSPEELPAKMQGGFGLVWDGDGLESCTGFFGEYQRYNSPHKVSLYIVSHLPIICWKKSALYDFIESNNLGFGINSLLELENTIEKITQKEYNSMQEAVAKMAQKLRNGTSLLSVIN